MTDRLRSGHRPLDDVLGGGLPANAISLIMGRPGSGKTIVAQQYVFRNATPERPAFYLSTVSEPLEKIVRFGQSLDFFDRAAIGRSVFYEGLGATLSRDGLSGVTGYIAGLLRERRPGMIVIDSFKALPEFASEQGGFRRFLHDLAGRLSAYPVSSLWVGEYEGHEISSMAEFAIADAILEMSTADFGQRQIRFMQVRKLRGSYFRSGLHAYRLSASGLHLFPRLADAPIEQHYPMADVRESSGIDALDAMLADGYWPGASTLIAGPSGSGKTLMGLHFIFAGARRGEPGVIATLQENATQLRRVVAGFGWSLNESGVELMYRSPVDIYIDEWVYDLLELVEKTGARRVLIDSLADLRMAAGDEVRFREFVFSLVQRFSLRGVSVMMTFELPELFESGRLSATAMSALSDNVVLVGYAREGDSIGRTISVIKTRASQHDPGVHRFSIEPEGIVLQQP